MTEAAPAVDWQAFLDHVYYATDFSTLISDVADFLEFSESTIERRYREERDALQHQHRVGELDPEYYEHLSAGVDQRFNVSLPTRIRYSALVGLVTAVDWSVEFLTKNSRKRVPKTPRHTNRGLHVLKFFNDEVSMHRDRTLQDYGNLVTLRDAIVHGAGIVRVREEQQLQNAVNALRGFRLDGVVWLGNAILIERGALESYIRDMSDFVPALYEAADKKGLLLDS